MTPPEGFGIMKFGVQDVYVYVLNGLSLCTLYLLRKTGIHDKIFFSYKK